jgi:putative ABC transport system permease protein
MALVVRQSAVLVTIGILVGVGGSAAITRYLEGMLLGDTPLDLTTFAVVVVLFAAIATLASYVPARRACSLPLHIDCSQRRPGAILGRRG